MRACRAAWNVCRKNASHSLPSCGRRKEPNIPATLPLCLISIFTCAILSLSHASHSHSTIEVYVGSGNIEQTKRLPVKHTCDGHFNVTLKRAHRKYVCMCAFCDFSMCTLKTFVSRSFSNGNKWTDGNEVGLGWGAREREGEK